MTSRTQNAIAGIGSVIILLLMLIAVGAVKSPPERYLVIHSDDAGFNSGVNDATIRGMEQGVVSSSSMMVMLPGFDEIADYAIAHPEKDFGVHLVLTAEKPDVRWGPVLKDEVPSLVQADGSFWHTSEQVAEHARVEEAARELRAQIQKALDRQIPITHLDHHMWVMLQRPDLLRLYVELGREFHLPIRLHRTFTAKECGKELQDAAVYRMLVEPAAARGNPVFDLIETDNYDVPPDGKRAYFLKQLRALKGGVSEFVIHCSSTRPGEKRPPHAERRAADARFFTSPEATDEIRRLGIKVVTWKELLRLQGAGKLGPGAAGSK